MHGRMIDVGFTLSSSNQNKDDASDYAWSAAQEAFLHACPGWSDESRDEFAEAVQCAVYKYMDRSAVQPVDYDIRVNVSCFRGIRCMEVYVTTLVWVDGPPSVFAINRHDHVPADLTSMCPSAWD